MSDFLDRLIERSFGLSPVVRPRLPSLFEPPGMDAAAQPEPMTEAAETARLSGPRAAISDAPEPAEFTHEPRSRRRAPAHEFVPPVADEPAAQPSTRPSQTATTAAPSIESSESAPPEPRRSASPPQPSRRETQTPGTPSFSPAPPPAHTRPEVENFAHALTPPRAAAEQHSTTVINLTQPERGAPPLNSFEPPARREAVAQDGAKTDGQVSELGRQVEGLKEQVGRMQFRPASPEVRFETRSVEGEKIVERVRDVPFPAPPPAPAPPPVEQRPAQTPVFVQPRATQRARPQFEAHEPSNERTPEPTVNVTIGRIEVRAAPTAEAPARQERREQPPAAMSLRDYLRKRSGGHSR